MRSITPLTDFAASLNLAERAVHQKLLRCSLEYRAALEQIKTPAGRNILRTMVAQCAAQNILPNINPVDLDDKDQRLAAYVAPLYPPLDIQIQAPRELHSYISIEDGSQLKPEAFAGISQSILAWLQDRYCPPPHLKFRIEYSPILAEAGHPCPLEIWLRTCHDENASSPGSEGKRPP